MASLQMSLALGGINLLPTFPLHVLPKSTMQGVVSLHTPTAIACRGIYLRWVWRTRGRGDTDSGKGGELLFFQGQLAPGRYTFPFTAPAPYAPWTYSGYYISIGWEFVLEVDRGAFRHNDKVAYPFRLSPV